MTDQTPHTRDRYRLSLAQHNRASHTLAGGVATAFRANQLPWPITFDHGRGSRLWDIDGNEYIDYALAFGPMLLGHSPEPVVAAVEDQIHKGIGFGASHRLEAELSEAICRTMPSAELCIFNSSGSEAVHAALRIARAATGRRRIVKFRGHYHGWFDPIHVAVPGHLDGPGTSGQDPDAASSVTICEWNDLDAVEAALGTDVAAIIMEPIAVNGGCFIPDPGYLEGVRALADRFSAVLIFDEVITGYRVALGGAQQRLEVTPDLTILGKALGAGFPISAVCGKASVLQVARSGVVAHVGTFNANPICAAAALAAVSALERDEDEIYASLEAGGDQLADAFVTSAAESGLPIKVNNLGAAAHGFVSEQPVNSFRDVEQTDTAAYRRFAASLLDEGVHVIPRGLLYVSAVHDNSDLELTRSAVRRAAARVVTGSDPSTVPKRKNSQ